MDHVQFERRQIPKDWLQRSFDLIMLSEVLYYLSPADVARTGRLARDSLRPNGTVLSVHYVLSTNYPCSGDVASEIFIARSGISATRQRREAACRLDLL
jgi:hypothetical protein